MNGMAGATEHLTQQSVPSAELEGCQAVGQAYQQACDRGEGLRFTEA